MLLYTTCAVSVSSHSCLCTLVVSLSDMFQQSLTTGGCGHPVKKSTFNDNDIVMDVNLAYGEGIHFASRYIEAGNDAEYEVVDIR